MPTLRHLLDINFHPDRRELRVFGLAALVILGTVGGWVWWRGSVFGIGLAPNTARMAAIVLWWCAGLGGVLAIIAPQLLRLAFIGLSVIFWPVGLVVGAVILAAVYYLVMTPIGLLLRVFRGDPMHRSFDAAAATYWTKRESTGEMERYFRQW